MRIVKSIPHQGMNISIYHWNNKYIVKFENGDFEQSYRISEMDVTSIEEVEEIVTEKDFLVSVEAQFQEMAKAFYASVHKVNGIE